MLIHDDERKQYLESRGNTDTIYGTMVTSSILEHLSRPPQIILVTN